MWNTKRAGNAKQKKHSEYSLQFNRWCLIVIGAWPQTSASNIMEKISTIVLIPICTVAIVIIMLPCFLYVTLEAEDIPSKLNAIGPMLHRVMGSVNYWTLLSRSRDIQNCIRHMDADSELIQRVGDREIMLRYAKIGRFMAGICTLFMHTSAFFFSIAKAVRTVSIIVDNETITMYPMTCPIYRKFIDARFSPVNQIMLGVQFSSTFVVSCSTVGVCSLAAVFAMHACGQLNVLYVWLKELSEDNEEEAEHKLAAIVEHHLRALSFVARVESIMHKACLVEMMGCTLNMCLLGYYCIMNWGAFDAAKIASYILVYLSMCFNIFIFCYIGEVLTEQCKNVGKMAYMTKWYKLRNRTALGLVLIIGRSSNVTKMTAGKLFHLSITTFGDIIKTSMAYLNILRTMATIVSIPRTRYTATITMRAFRVVATAQLYRCVCEASRKSLLQDSPIMSNYLEDKEYSIQPIRWLLKPISVWPVKKSSYKERILSRVLLIVCIFLIVSTLVPCALAVFLDETKDLETKVREFGPLSNWLLASLKYCALLMHVGDIGQCIEHIETDWRTVTKIEERGLMLRNARIGRFIAIFSAIFVHCGVFSYNIFRGMTMDESATKEDNTSMYSLPFAFYDKILDTTISPAYEIVFAIQYLSTFVVNSVGVGTCSITAVFVMHACGQLKILMSLLDNLVDETNEKRDSTQQKFVVIVEHHLRVLNFVSRIEKITNVVCLVEIVGCTMHMCLLGYYCILDWSQDEKEGIVAYCIILISVTFNIFIFCYIGEILSDQCGQVGEIAYMTNWYLLPGNTALGLVLIILRSSIIIKITAGKMIELSLSTFGNVIKSAVAYLNILRTLM
nr:PREDICTED: uncharacterized protein LOC105667432 [Linepithema humile]